MKMFLIIAVCFSLNMANADLSGGQSIPRKRTCPNGMHLGCAPKLAGGCANKICVYDHHQASDQVFPVSFSRASITFAGAMATDLYNAMVGVVPFKVGPKLTKATSIALEEFVPYPSQGSPSFSGVYVNSRKVSEALELENAGALFSELWQGGHGLITHGNGTTDPIVIIDASVSCSQIVEDTQSDTQCIATQ